MLQLDCVSAPAEDSSYVEQNVPQVENILLENTKGEESSDNQNIEINMGDHFDSKVMVGAVERCALGENDILIIMIVLAAMQLNLNPNFELNLKNILQKDTLPSTTSFPSANRGGAYPPLTFSNHNKTIEITITVVSVFSEMVIYATKKTVNIANMITEKRDVISNDMNYVKIAQIGNIERITNEKEKSKKEKRKTLTLYLTVNNFIFPYISNFEKSTEKNENSQNLMVIVENYVELIVVGTYSVKLYELTKKISDTLFLPLINEKYVHVLTVQYSYTKFFVYLIAFVFASISLCFNYLFYFIIFYHFLCYHLFLFDIIFLHFFSS